MFGTVDFISTEVIAVLGTAALLAGYHLYLRRQVRRNPAYSIQAVNDRARRDWVENLMRNRCADVLAVQTLRNSTMAAAFLASTAIVLIIGVLHLAPANLQALLESFDPQSVPDDTRWALRLLPLLVDLFWAFFCFTLAIRANNHVGYLINADCQSSWPTPSYVAKVLNQGTACYTLGMRAYYLTVPLIIGLFNPLYMVAATTVVIVVLYHIDRAPDLGGQHSSAATEGAAVTIRRFRCGKAQNR